MMLSSLALLFSAGGLIDSQFAVGTSSHKRFAKKFSGAEMYFPPSAFHSSLARHASSAARTFSSNAAASGALPRNYIYRAQHLAFAFGFL